MELYEKLKLQAIAEDRTQSAILNRALRNYLENAEQDKE